MNEMAKDSTLHRVFCQQIIARRKELDLTQADVAERLGIARPAYSAIEAGRKTPGLDTVERVANALQIPAIELLGTMSEAVI
jgi:transcriptional regulator with XRE-family HTH domain